MRSLLLLTNNRTDITLESHKKENIFHFSICQLSILTNARSLCNKRPYQGKSAILVRLQDCTSPIYVCMCIEILCATNVISTLGFAIELHKGNLCAFVRSILLCKFSYIRLIEKGHMPRSNLLFPTASYVWHYCLPLRIVHSTFISCLLSLSYFCFNPYLLNRFCQD